MKRKNVTEGMGEKRALAQTHENVEDFYRRLEYLVGDVEAARKSAANGNDPGDLTDSLAKEFTAAINLISDLVSLVIEVKTAGERKAAAARKDADSRVLGVKSVTIQDLIHAKNLKLISEHQYNVERGRRAKQAPLPIVLPSNSFGSGAVIGGFLSCPEPGCGALVKLKTGSSGYCPDHQKPEPRQFLTANFQARDLDANLRRAEEALAKATAATEEAEKRLAKSKSDILAYDQNGRAGA